MMTWAKESTSFRMATGPGSPGYQLNPWKTVLENWKIEEKSWNFFFSKHNYFLIFNFCFIKQKVSEIVYFSGKSFLWKIYFHELSCFTSFTTECIELLHSFVPGGVWGGGGASLFLCMIIISIYIFDVAVSEWTWPDLAKQ